MLPREQTEQWEREKLSPWAQLVSHSRGRRMPEPKDDIRTDFQRDRDCILHSKTFRRLKHKTQVFISPEGDHYRTRLTHTLEVAQIARTMARALNLNEDLVEAMALGHDVGHTPFGHAGEAVLQQLVPGFQHARQSVRVLEFLEKSPRRQGLNLTEEVLDGIANHSGDHVAHTLEGRLLKFADRIAYVNHDIDDSMRAGILTLNDLPPDAVRVLGKTTSDRIDRMVNAVISWSTGKNEIGMEPEVYAVSRALRAFMFREVYTNDEVKGENHKLYHIIRHIFSYYLDHPEELPQSHRGLYVGEHAAEPPEVIVADYIAGMTDVYLIHTYRDLFIPRVWDKM